MQPELRSGEHFVVAGVVAAVVRSAVAEHLELKRGRGPKVL